MLYVQALIAAALYLTMGSPSGDNIEESKEITADGSPRVDTRISSATKVDRHREIHGRLDMRSTVLLVINTALLVAVMKDGAHLIPPAFMLIHVWTCVFAYFAIGYGLLARLKGLDDRTSVDFGSQLEDEKVTMGPITRKKAKGHNFGLVIVGLDVLVIALGYTVSFFA